MKLTELQLVELRKTLKEQSQEQRISHDSDLPMHEEHMENSDMMRSMYDRLSNAVMLREWSLVDEVVGDIKRYMESTYKSKEDISSEIGVPSSVESDDDDEYQERNYGVNESIDRIKSDFKRFI